MATKKTVTADAKKASETTDGKNFTDFASVLKSKAKGGLPYGTRIAIDASKGLFHVEEKSGRVMCSGDLDEFAKGQFKKLGFKVV